MNEITVSPRPTLVYVHGVGGPKSGWFRVLRKRVRSIDPSTGSDLNGLVTVDFTHIVGRRGHDDRPHSTYAATPSPRSTS